MLRCFDALFRRKRLQRTYCQRLLAASRRPQNAHEAPESTATVALGLRSSLPHLRQRTWKNRVMATASPGCWMSIGSGRGPMPNSDTSSSDTFENFALHFTSVASSFSPNYLASFDEGSAM